MNLEAVKISRCPLPPERSWPRGWAETGRWSPLADQWGCVRLYTPLDSPLNNASSFSIRGPQAPSIYDHSGRLFLPGTTSSSPSCLPPSPLVTTSLRAWVHLLCTAPRLLITAAALICEGWQGAGELPAWGCFVCFKEKPRSRYVLSRFKFR